MSSKARGLADLGNAFDDGALSNRNLIINGAMQVAQRGTSATGVNASAYNTVDRFQYAEGTGGGGGALTVSQSTEAPAGFSNSFKFEVTTTDTLSGSENILIRQRLEGQDVQRLKFGSSAAESVTISFWVKSSLTGTFGLELMAGPSANRTALQAYTVSAANTWQYVSLTFAGSTDYSIPNDNARGFDVIWMLDSGPDDIRDPYAFKADASFRAPTGQVNFMATSGATFQITGVQLEVGDTATPFENRSYSDQLQTCKRYYQQKSDSGNALASGIWYTASQVLAYGKFDTTMRAAPTITVSSSDFAQCYTQGTARATLDSSPCDNTGVNETRYNLTVGTSGTQGDGTHVQLNSSEAIYFDAEL